MYDRVRTTDVDFRVRGALSLDVRDQTDYGTLRSYFRIGINQTTPTDGQGGAVFWDRAFIQWAGFTIGKAQSFYDTVTYGGALHLPQRAHGVGYGCLGLERVGLYGAVRQRLSGTLSFEDPNRDHRVIDNTCTVRVVTFPFVLNHNSGINGQDGTACAADSASTASDAPDIIGNLRVDQSWGYAALGLAAHNVNAAYYGAPNNVNNGHPNEKYGWAISSGVLGQDRGWAHGRLSTPSIRGARPAMAQPPATGFSMLESRHQRHLGLRLRRHLRWTRKPRSS